MDNNQQPINNSFAIEAYILQEQLADSIKNIKPELKDISNSVWAKYLRGVFEEKTVFTQKMLKNK